MTREQIIDLREEADNFALKALSCEGEFHPDFHTVSDERFYTIAFEAGMDELRQQLAERDKQIMLYEKALLASWPQGAIGGAFDFWNAARKLSDTEPTP
jgi:hypothetical protein